ncbi:MAG: heavy metal translocating P-type ATPase [Defluviitaleaceae bacterium]|nr:heavy metal translocating P-type ATPase [Defluviitaleaceae bacterium]
MKIPYKIVYDKFGRIRFRFGANVFTREEGYSIEALFLSCVGVQNVVCNAINGSVLVDYKSGTRDFILEIINNIDIENLPLSKPRDENYIREIESNFYFSLAKKIAVRYSKIWFLPFPIRKIFIIYESIGYFKAGLKALFSLKMNVDLIDATAILVSILNNDYSTAGNVMFMLGISDILEEYTRKKSTQVLSSCLSLNIENVWTIKNDNLKLTPIGQINIGDVIQVHAGNTIPLDGKIIKGEASVNEASMTGEAVSVLRNVDNVVYAGTVIEEGNIDIEVSSTQDNTRINKIISLIDNSEDYKSNLQSKSEKLANNIVPFSFLAVALTFAFTKDIMRSTSVLMVDYSCAIKLTTPIYIMSAMRYAASSKILIKGGKHLEEYATADTIVFDKTGTLTLATPTVAKIITFGDITRREALKISACLEEHFPHSVAKAIVKQAEIEDIKHREEHDEPKYIIAHGISSMLKGKPVLIGSHHFIFEDEKINISDEDLQIINQNKNGYTTIFLAIDSKLAAMICIEDPVRSEAFWVINSLKNLGIKRVIMITGDSEPAAKAVSRELGIDEYYFEVLPHGKVEIIEKLKEQGNKIIMVGDGINDSPALTFANVSVAMKDSSDIAKEVADVTLLTEDLKGLVELRNIATVTLDKISRNFGYIVGINTSLILLGSGGFISPSTSAFLHNSSTIGLSLLSMK